MIKNDYQKLLKIVYAKCQGTSCNYVYIPYSRFRVMCVNQVECAFKQVIDFGYSCWLTKLETFKPINLAYKRPEQSKQNTRPKAATIVWRMAPRVAHLNIDMIQILFLGCIIKAKN